MAEISIGGKQWQVPQLAIKQNRIIDPLVLALLPIFYTWKSDPATISKIGREQYDSLLTIVYTAITRAKPDFTLQQFEDLPATLPELINAFSIIAQQTGIFAKADTPGEVKAG